MGEPQAVAETRFFQEERRGGEAFDVRAIGTSIPSTGVVTTVASFFVGDGLVGILRAVGHETTGLGWAAISWQIQVNGRPFRNYGAQVGMRWGFLQGPGDVYVTAQKGQTIRITAAQSSGAAILASARLLGSTWAPAFGQ